MKEKYKHFIPIQASKPKPSIKQILENQNIMQYIQHELCGHNHSSCKTRCITSPIQGPTLSVSIQPSSKRPFQSAMIISINSNIYAILLPKD